MSEVWCLTKFKMCDMNITLSTNCTINMKAMLLKRYSCSLEEVVASLEDFCTMGCDPRLMSDHLKYKPNIKIVASNASITAGDQEILASIQAFPPCDNVTAVFTASDTSENSTLVISKVGLQETSMDLCNLHWREQVANMGVNVTDIGVPGTVVIRAWNSVGCSEEHVMIEGTATTTVPTTVTSPRPSIPTTTVAVNHIYWIIGPIVAALVGMIVVIYKCVKNRRDGNNQDGIPDQSLARLRQSNEV